MKIFISAGDPSGDLHGSNLIKELKLQNAGVEVFGFGGSKMAAVSTIFDRIADASIIGFWEPLKNLVRLKADLNSAATFFKKEKPAGVILIDYYGFNIHIAELAKKYKIPVVYYVLPQIWATRRGRVKKLRKFVKKVLAIFPFEPNIYEKAGIPCEFVGHPLLDVIPDISAVPSGYPLYIGLMPGSRLQEINKHFTPFYEAFVILHKVFPDAKVIIPVFSDTIRTYIVDKFSIDEDKVEFVMHGDYAKRAKMALCITSSGTATIENMILGIPMVISYKTSWLTYAIAKSIINVKFIGMPNILAGEEICPELIQSDATAQAISRKGLEILKDPLILANTRAKLADTVNKLGNRGATKRAASSIMEEFFV